MPLLLEVTDATKAASWLDAVAGPTFSVSWGVRLRPATQPRYDPSSRHGGVWPLFTGLVAWAEYRAGRAEAAFRHWRSNVNIAFERERGAWDDVLHGRRRRPIGVCSNHATSAAMVVAPFVYGMLGVVPDAPYGRVRIAPQFPQTWRHARVTNLRVGDARIMVRYQRSGHMHTYNIEQTAGSLPFTLIFEPAIPAAAIDRVVIDGRGAQLEEFRTGERTSVRVQLALDHARIMTVVASEGRRPR